MIGDLVSHYVSSDLTEFPSMFTGAPYEYIGRLTKDTQVVQDRVMAEAAKAGEKKEKWDEN